jgi:hypothetical protein
MLRIRDKRDFLAGLLLMGFGTAAFLIARNYPMGTAFRMGPGYFPVVLSFLLAGIGAVVAATSLRSAEVPLPRLAWRPFLVVTGAVVLFGLLINGAGLLATTFALVIAGRLARPGHGWGETVLLGAGVSALCVAVFYFALRVQMPLLPMWG